MFKLERSTPEGWLEQRATIRKRFVNPSRKLYVNEPFIASPGSSEPLHFNVPFNNF